MINSGKFESIDEKSTVIQKSNFDFLVNIGIQKSRIIKTFKTIKLDHQELKNSIKVKSWKVFQHLEKNLSVFVLNKITTSWPFFTKIQVDSKKVFNMKVVDKVSRFPKCPRE